MDFNYQTKINLLFVVLENVLDFPRGESLRETNWSLASCCEKVSSKRDHLLYMESYSIARLIFYFTLIKIILAKL